MCYFGEKNYCPTEEGEVVNELKSISCAADNQLIADCARNLINSVKSVPIAECEKSKYVLLQCTGGDGDSTGTMQISPPKKDENK